MNEQAIKDSYELFKTGGYSKSYEEFVELINSNPQALEDSYTLFQTGGYTKGMAEYEELMGVKKKDEPTESTWEGGLLEPSEAPDVMDFSGDASTIEQPFSTQAPRPQDIRSDGSLQEGLTPEKLEQLQVGREAERVRNAAEDEAMRASEAAKEEADKLALETARNVALNTPEVDNMLSQVNAELVGLEEKEVVEKMQALFKGRGFTFEKIGLGLDRMRVRTTDGMHSIDIELDNFLSATDLAESAELQTFLRTHFNPTVAPTNEDEISKSLRAQELRGGNERWNEDGTQSTVKFMSYEEDGVHKVVPTLFPRRTKGNISPRSEDWMELGFKDAIAEAERRGEVFTFESQEEAEAFAEGSWKTTNNIDLEGQKFYNKYGRDYIADREAYDNYEDAHTTRLFLEEQVAIASDSRWGSVGQYDDLSPQEQKEYARFFREDGSLRDDAAAIAESLDNEEAALWGIVDNDNFRIAQEDFDVHLEKRHSALAQDAANANYQARTIQQGLENQSLQEFGVSLDRLNTYKPKNENERVRLNEMIALQNATQSQRELAATQYETALTYYDAKANKELHGEFTNNLEGWAIATADGYRNGKAGQELLYLAMGIYDSEDEDQREAAAQRMTDYMNAVDGRQSRAMSRFNSAEEGWNREVRGALRRDPAEVMLTWAASSLSQILPYGAKIIPSFVLSGAATGAGMASLGGPVSAGAGAVTGGVWGLRTGFAATNLVLEYTNGVLDAGREFGYDMNNPEEAAQAFSDDKVWARGKERGLKRGIPIAIMDIFAGGLAGRIFKPVAVAGRAAKVGAFVGERVVVDSAFEAAGEALAQVTVGDEVSFKEILAEAGGAIGNQSTNAAVNIYRATRGRTNQRIAKMLMDTKLIAFERSSNTQIQTWTNNMLKLGKISPKQGQRILENVGLRDEATALLGAKGTSIRGPRKEVHSRVMELLNARKGLESNSNTRAIFSEEISKINAELSLISRTSKVSPRPYDISNINTFDGQGRRSTVPSYRIGNSVYSKAEFLKYIENLSPRRANKIIKDSRIVNDEETSALLDEKLKKFITEDTSTEVEITDAEVSAEIKMREEEGSRVEEGKVTAEERAEVKNDLLKQRKNAIQESSTTEVDAQESTADSEQVGEGVTVEAEEEAQEQVDAQEEEVAVEVVDKGTRKDVDSFRNNTLEESRKKSLLAGIAKRLNDGRKLTKFQAEMLSNNNAEVAELQDVVATQDAVTQEAVDLEESLSTDEVSKPRTVEVEAAPEAAPEVKVAPKKKTKKATKPKKASTKKTKVAAAPVEETQEAAPLEDVSEDYSDEIADIEGGIEDAENEINSVKSDLKEDIEKVKKKIAVAKKSKKSKNAKAEKVEELKNEIVDLKEDAASQIEEYKDDISELKRDRNKINKKIKKAAAVSKTKAKAKTKTKAKAKTKTKAKAKLKVVPREGESIQDAIRRTRIEEDQRNKKAPEFRMEGESLGVSQDKTDMETFAILERMNEMGAEVRAAEAQEIIDIKSKLEGKLKKAERVKLEQRLSELENMGRPRETEGKATKIDVDELNSRLDNPLPVISWKVVDGVPMIFNISDQLRTGDVVNPATGTTIKNLKGGLGFTGVEGHQDMAWASVTREKAEAQINNATKVYNDNKEVFKEWWKANPQYKGLVPMSIVKMGQSSILSNEAVVRVLADNLKSFPLSKRKAALVAFKKQAIQEIKSKEKSIKTGKNEKGEKLSKQTISQYKAKIGEINDVMAMIKKVGPSSIDGILTQAALKELKGITSVNVITSYIMSGKPNEVGETKRKPGKAKKAVPAILLGENPSETDKAKLNAGVVTDLITEPQLEGVPQRSVFMIQGVDVLNPAVLESTHPNYPVGPRGKTIGVLEQPQSVIDLFPSMANNVMLGIAEEQRGSRRRSERSRLTQKLPVQAGMPNVEFLGSIAGIDQRASVLDFLGRSFPSVTMSVDFQTFENVLASEGVREYLKGDEIIYGVTKDGDIYLNPDIHDSNSALFNTAVHELGHVWTDYLQTTAKGKKVYAKGASLVSQTAEYANQLKRFRGTKDASGNILTDEQVKTKAVNETMAILIGNKGETIIEASLRQKFQEWLVSLWTYVKDTFKMSKDLKTAEIENLTLDAFLGTALADIMSGKELKIDEKKAYLLKNPEAAFSRTDSMTDVISRGRAEGFSEASIREVLKGRGHLVSDIKRAMAVSIKSLNEQRVPFEFGNVFGGIDVGIEMFKRIQTQVVEYSKNATSSEVRAKALELLQADPEFNEQTEEVKMNLVLALDRVQNISANRAVSKQLQAIRTALSQRKEGAKNLQEVKRQLRQFIRYNLPKSNDYSQTDINRFVKAISVVDDAKFDAQAEKILQLIEKQRSKMRSKVLKKLLSDVTSGAKKKTTSTKKSRAGSLDPKGQAFAQEFKIVLRAAMSSLDVKEGELSGIQKIAASLETNEAISALAKSAAGEQLTVKEEVYVNQAVALDLVKNIESMELEEVELLAKEYGMRAKMSRQELSATRQKRVLAQESVRKESTESLRKSNPELFNADGTLKDTNERRALLDKVREYWVEGKGKGLSARLKGQVKAAKTYVETYKWRSGFQLWKSMVSSVKHLGTFMNSINETLYDTVFNKLNKMDNDSLAGYFKQQKRLTDLGYDDVQQSLFDTELYTVKGVSSSTTKNLRDEAFSKDQLLRIYALSKNPIQRNKLREQGFTDEKMADIEKYLGKDAIEFADRIVQYLSNEYYESVNDVYRASNDVNLAYLENYFPTMTTQSETKSTPLFDGDFNGIFNAESAPALQGRTDMKSDINLKGATFTSALESHIKTMEHYKAYAEGTKTLNTIFNTPAVDAALTMLGIKPLVKQSVNNAINPDSGKNALNTSGKVFNILQTQFTAYALAYKAMQVVKQATSFINAFDNYSFRKGKKIGFGVDILIDAVPFLMDFGVVMAQPRKYIKMALDMSPTFKYRVRQGLKGDLSGLESGSPTITGFENRNTKFAKLWRAHLKAGGSATIIGDLIGVMGYMANYRRNIKNGMSQEDAVAAFNEFNSTQQSRRATEKAIIQQNSNFLVRGFTMFGSTPILMTNNVMQASTNIVRDMKAGKKPKDIDVRKLILNLGAANAAFVAMSNIGMLMRGDEEEKEEVYRQIRNAMLGLNLIYQIPFVGSAVKNIENEMTGNRRPTDLGVNPMVSLVKKMIRDSEDDKLMEGMLKTTLEIGIGAQTDPLMALLRSAKDLDAAGIKELYDIIGYSESYREESAKDDYEAPTRAYERELDAKARKKAKQEANPAYVRGKAKEKEQREKERNKYRYNK